MGLLCLILIIIINWFIPMYCIMLLSFPLLNKSIKNKSHIAIVFIGLITKLLGKFLLTDFSTYEIHTKSNYEFFTSLFFVIYVLSVYLIVFYTGMICSTKILAFEKFIRNNKVLSFVVILLVIAISDIVPFCGFFLL